MRHRRGSNAGKSKRKRTPPPAKAALSPAARRAFRRRLLAWYGRHGRDLPWRQTDDPYRVLVSEIMLQQTQVDRVLPKYGEWLTRFPTLGSLAAATEDEAIHLWYPLGYNVRPKRLHAIAREAVARYGGQLPSDPEALRAFKGIGAYTEGAILSFAFRRRAAILDTNVARVLFRVFIGHGNPGSHATKKTLWEMSRALVPATRAFDFNQGLMDFGAMVCVARKPKCLVCPMTSICRAFPYNPEREERSRVAGSPPAERRPGRQRRTRGPVTPDDEAWPLLPDPGTVDDRRAARKTHVVAAVIERDGALLLTERLKGTHLAGCWEFPGGKCGPAESLVEALRRELREELDVEARVGRLILTSEHAYEEGAIVLHFFECAIDGEPRPVLGQRIDWARREDLGGLRFPPADRELVAMLTSESL